jgi:hypothetical protein
LFLCTQSHRPPTHSGLCSLCRARYVLTDHNEPSPVLFTPSITHPVACPRPCPWQMNQLHSCPILFILSVHITVFLESAPTFCSLQVYPFVSCVHFAPVHVTCPAYSVLGSHRFFCFVLDANINLTALFRRTIEPCYSLNIEDQFSHPLKGRIFIIPGCVLVFMLCG